MPSHTPHLPLPFAPLAVLLALLIGSTAHPAHAHGTRIDYVAGAALVITITATYDSGSPMAQAQVLVYAPDDPATPWLTGTTRADGTFQFIPDPQRSGTWEVVVREAGHGGTVYIPLTAELAASQSVAVAGSSNTMSPLQTVLMGAAVVWGFVATALYFAQRRTTHAPR